MSRRPAALALLLGLALAVGAGACGSDDPQESGATAVPPLTAPTQGTAATTATTTATTGTTTAPPSTTSATTPTTTSPQTGGATPTTPAQSGGAPAGCPAAVGGFIRDVRVSGTDCSVAQTVAGAWFDAVHEGAAPDGPVDAAGYACGATLAGERASVTCSGVGGRVFFTASP